MTDAIQAAAYRILEGTSTTDDAAAVALAYFRMITARAQDALAKGGANFDDAVRLLAKPRPETITLIESAIQVGLSAKDILGALYAHLAALSAHSPTDSQPSRDDVLEEAAKAVDRMAESLQSEGGAWFTEIPDQLKYKYQASILRYAAKDIRALKSPAAKVTT